MAGRYLVNPGQAGSHLAGRAKAQKAQKAQKAPGDSFTLKAFNKLVLQTGDVPLALLAQLVDG